MLRGRCSYTISERPGTSTGTQPTRPTPSSPLRLLATSYSPLVSSHFAPSTFNFERFSPVTPLFPLHPGNSPVTPLFPLHTQKQGGGAPFSAIPLHSSSVLSVSPAVNHFSGARDSNRLEISAATRELSTRDCELASLKPPFTRELIEYVGAPTFLISARPLFSANLCVLCASALSFSPGRAASTRSPDPLISNLKLTTDNLKLRNPNHSRTSETFARKSNYSRRYATGLFT